MLSQIQLIIQIGTAVPKQPCYRYKEAFYLVGSTSNPSCWFRCQKSAVLWTAEQIMPQASLLPIVILSTKLSYRIEDGTWRTRDACCRGHCHPHHSQCSEAVSAYSRKQGLMSSPPRGCRRAGMSFLLGWDERTSLEHSHMFAMVSGLQSQQQPCTINNNIYFVFHNQLLVYTRWISEQTLLALS